MPGVGDAERRTRLALKKKARQDEHANLLRMVKEGRLHEADERQLETIRLALEISDLLKPKTNSESLPTVEFVDAIKQAIRESLSYTQLVDGNKQSQNIPERPKMRHVSLTDVKCGEDKLSVQGDLEGEEKTTEGSDKLEKLKRLKGKK